MLRKILFTALIFVFVATLVPNEPAEALSTLNDYPEWVYYWNDSAYVGETGDAQTDTPGDVFLGHTASPKDNTLYITMGHTESLYAYFDELYINVTTPGDTGAVVWQYYSEGDGWRDLNETDETNGFTKSGWGKVSWEIPSDWVGSSVNGKAGRWIRVRTTTSYYTQPLAGQIEVRAYNLHVKVEDDAGVGIAGLNADNFALTDCDDTKVYGIREELNGIYELALQARSADTNCLISVSKLGYSSPIEYSTGDLGYAVTDKSHIPFVLSKIEGVSSVESEITTNKTTLIADGAEYAEISVFIKDASRQALDGVEVILESSRSEDSINPLSAITDSSGLATFQVSATAGGESTITATAGGILIDDIQIITFSETGLGSGTLIKASTNDAVYYLANDGKRYAFPNSKVYFSWYNDFSGVVEISASELAAIALGGNVTYRPGVRMIKIQSDPKTYAVTEGGVLRWIQTEELAIALYGTEWNTMIDDIDVAFWVNYNFGDDITDAGEYNPGAATSATATINQNLGL